MNKVLTLFITLLMFASTAHAQQDAQFTQYVYNTININPAYAGSREALSLNALYRTQQVGLDGAPRTFSFSGHSPLKNERLGLGVSVRRDDIFIIDETFVDVDFSYTIPTSARGKLAFGIRGGLQLFNIDFARLNPENDLNGEFSTANNVDNRFSPNVGVGLYYYTNKFYIGYSAPTLLRTEFFDENGDPNSSFLARDRVTHNLIAGYVFNLSQKTKFKPAALVRAVSGAPIGLDLSGSLLFNDKFSIGLNYRLDAAVSVLAAFQISDALTIGYAYDRDTTELRNFNDGSHEIFLRLELKGRKSGIISPRFF